MPEEAQKKVDDLIDVGEADQQAAEINLDDKGEPEKVEPPKEEKIEVEKIEAGEAPETKVEKKEEKDEVKEYSEGVQKRIAKLTRKMREAERQKEEAIAFAEATNKQKSELEGRLSKLDKSYTSEFESRVKNSMVAAKQALKTAIEYVQSLDTFEKIDSSFVPKKGANAGDFYKKLGFVETGEIDDCGEIGITLILKPSTVSKSFAKCKPIFPPPIISIFFANFSS